MTYILLSIVFAFLVITGIWNLFQKGMLLGDLGTYLEKKLPNQLLKPFFLCPACMASIWGTVLFFLVVKVEIVYWPFFCLAVSGLAKLTFDKLYSK